MLGESNQTGSDTQAREKALPSVARADCIFMASVCERMHKFDTMISYMKMALEHDPELNDEEKRLLTIGYKLALNAPRNSHKIASL